MILLIILFTQWNFFFIFSNFSLLLIIIIIICFFYLKVIINRKIINFLLIINLIFCILFFITNNIFLFYIIFEFAVYPILLIIAVFGYQIERLQARTFFLRYTLFFRVPSMIVFILFQIYFVRFNNFFLIKIIKFTLFFLIMIFRVKLPLFILHIWLPKAHVEAPTVGRILLAAILLKLGAFGFLKFILIINSLILLEIIIIISFLGGIFSCFLCILQRDVKALIAYSRVVHINFILLGLLLKNFLIKYSFVLIIFFHALISSIIFFKAGIIFQNWKSRKIYFRSISRAPNKLILVILIIIFVLNFNIPPSLGIIPEIHLFTIIFKFNRLLLIFLLIFGLMSAFFCIFIIINLSRGKNRFIKINNYNYNIKIFNLPMIIFCCTTLFILLF